MSEKFNNRLIEIHGNLAVLLRFDGEDMSTPGLEYLTAVKDK